MSYRGVFWGVAYPKIELLNSAGGVVQTFRFDEADNLLGFALTFDPIGLTEFEGQSISEDRFSQRYLGWRLAAEANTEQLQNATAMEFMRALVQHSGRIRLHPHDDGLVYELQGVRRTWLDVVPDRGFAPENVSSGPGERFTGKKFALKLAGTELLTTLPINISAAILGDSATLALKPETDIMALS